QEADVRHLLAGDALVDADLSADAAREVAAAGELRAEPLPQLNDDGLTEQRVLDDLRVVVRPGERLKAREHAAHLGPALRRRVPLIAVIDALIRRVVERLLQDLLQRGRHGFPSLESP